MINQQSYPPPLWGLDFTVSAVAALGLWKGQQVLLYTTSPKRIKQLKNSIVRCLLTLARSYLQKDLTGLEKQELMKTCEDNIMFVTHPRLRESSFHPTMILDDSPISKQELCLMDRIQNTLTKQQ